VDSRCYEWSNLESAFFWPGKNEDIERARTRVGRFREFVLTWAVRSVELAFDGTRR